MDEYWGLSLDDLSVHIYDIRSDAIGAHYVVLRVIGQLPARKCSMLSPPLSIRTSTAQPSTAIAMQRKRFRCGYFSPRTRRMPRQDTQ